MWICQYCGNNKGVYFKDNQLEGIVCLNPECGRFNQFEQTLYKIFDSEY